MQPLTPEALHLIQLSHKTYQGLSLPNLVLVEETRKPMMESLKASQTLPVKMMARTYTGSSWTKIEHLPGLLNNMVAIIKTYYDHFQQEY